MIPEGVGDLAIAFEQLKAKLYAEGLFDPDHKKPLPAYPEKIAIVTSSAGAAVHDMIRILRRRYPIAKVILLPVRVQGTEAPPEIAGAIRYADRWKIGDVIITGRGGGSMEDLWAFNDERVARAIYDCETPIISAVGHEPDVTISDFVADARASTPSNAAEIAVPDQVELLRWLRGAGERMEQSETQRLETLRQRLDTLAAKRCMTDHLAYVQDKRMELVHLQQRLGDLSGAQLARRRQHFAALASSLDAMSPLKVLGRGYAMAKSEGGQIIKSYRDVTAGDRVSVTLGEGGFTCTVQEPLKEVHE
jgi:exodeoxyribonuclease VII large subunit